MGSSLSPCSSNHMNRDAVRIAEQLRSQIKQRPAVVLISPLEQARASGDLAWQVAQRVAASGEESVFFIDVDAFRNETVEHKTLWITGDDSGLSETDLLEKQSSSAAGPCSIAVRVDSSEAGRQAFAPIFKRLLQVVRTRYSFIVMSSFPTQEEEIFGLVAASDFCVVRLTQGKSSRTEFASFCRDCALVSDTPLGAVLEG